jgi:hypothetical protein
MLSHEQYIMAHHVVHSSHQGSQSIACVRGGRMHCSIFSIHSVGSMMLIRNRSHSTRLKKVGRFWTLNLKTRRNSVGTMHNLGSRKCKLGIKANHFKAATRKKAQEFTRKMLFTFVYHVLPYENVSARIGSWISPPPNRCVSRFRFLVDLSYPKHKNQTKN